MEESLKKGWGVQTLFTDTYSHLAYAGQSQKHKLPVAICLNLLPAWFFLKYLLAGFTASIRINV